MKLKYKFIINDVAGSKVAVSSERIDDSFKGMIRLNETGEYIFKKLQKDSTVEQIAEALSKKYKISKQTATTDVVKFVEHLNSYGIIEM
ncbi:MAG: PqqD family protein [Clostridia bacterium]|nr:PqqD family protein [Clostridia bacterium]